MAPNMGNIFLETSIYESRLWWHTPLILRRWKPMDICDFEARLVYRVRH